VTALKKEVKEKLLPGEPGVSPGQYLSPNVWGTNRGFGFLSTDDIIIFLT
jgi:hypothetical protein